MNKEVCPKCGKVHEDNRVDLGIKVTKEELDSILLIRSKANSIAQASSLANIPEGVSQDTVDKYVKAIVNMKSEILFLEQDWWSSIMKKHNLTGEVHLDFSDGSLFTLA
jgi:hypothetical protein